MVGSCSDTDGDVVRCLVLLTDIAEQPLLAAFASSMGSRRVNMWPAPMHRHGSKSIGVKTKRYGDARPPFRVM